MMAVVFPETNELFPLQNAYRKAYETENREFLILLDLLAVLTS
jgi:hypothetical protein